MNHLLDAAPPAPNADAAPGSDPSQQPTPDTDRKGFPLGIAAGVAVVLVIAAVLLASGPDSPSGTGKPKSHESGIALELKTRAAREAREKKAGKPSTTATSVPSPPSSAVPQKAPAPTEVVHHPQASQNQSPRIAAAVAAAGVGLARTGSTKHHHRHPRVRHVHRVRHVRRVHRVRHVRRRVVRRHR
jgi:hypothetical protein